MDNLMLGICKSMIEKSIDTTINEIRLENVAGEDYLVFDLKNSAGEVVVKKVNINTLTPKIVASNEKPVNTQLGTIWVVTA